KRCGASCQLAIRYHRKLATCARGNLNSNRAPPPFVEGASRAEPPASSIRLRTIAKPKPVPLCLVVKNGSHIFAHISGEIHAPVSETEKLISRSLTDNSIVTWPPAGVACSAFKTRLESPSLP